MRENSQGKSVEFQSDTKAFPETINQEPELWALYPDISADAQDIVYVEGKDQTDLHLVYSNKADKTSQVFNLASPGMILHPKMTKNKKMIFYSAKSNQGKMTIHFFEPKKLTENQKTITGEFILNQSQLIDETEESYFPRPSADGTFVVYQRNTNGKREIVLYHLLTKEKKVLVEGMSPALSPDETKIAFTVKENDNWNIYEIDRFTLNIHPLTQLKGDEMAPAYRSDSELVFASKQVDRFDLMLLDLKTKMITSFKKSPDESTSFYSPQFSGRGEFTQDLLPALPGPERSSFGTILHENKIYVCGGHQGAEHTYPPESFTDLFYVYDLETKEWTELPPRPAKAHGFQLAAYGDYIYAFGGFAFSESHKPKWKSLTQIDRYNSKTKQWETIAHLLSPRSSNVAVNIQDKVYLIGGWDSTPQKENDAEGRFHRSIEIFDLRTNTIELAPFTMPDPLRRAFSGIERNGKILLIGGLGTGSTHFELLTHVTEIDPLSGSVIEHTALPFGTFAPAAGLLGNQLYVFGGMFKTAPMDYEYVSHIYEYNFEQKNWSHTGRYLQETKGFSQVLNLNSTSLGILGGHHYFDGFDSPVETFETFSLKQKAPQE